MTCPSGTRRHDTIGGSSTHTTYTHTIAHIHSSITPWINRDAILLFSSKSDSNLYTLTFIKMGANKKDDNSGGTGGGGGGDDGQETAAAAAGDSGTEKKITAPSPAFSSGSGIDSHPYARGSVIEVLHGVKEAIAKETFWWSDSDEEEDEGQMSAEIVEDEGVSVRLCDVIDRVPDGDDKWRYYVHYRDFNRRMDEWIGMEKIISPPSVGNAKARALKKQEEKLKRKLAKLEEEKMAAAETLQPRGPRLARRTSDLTSATTPTPGTAGSTLASAEEQTTTPRMTRRQRRKSDVMDGLQATLDGNATGEADTPLSSEMDVDKEVVTIATTAKAETKQVGQHVIATIPAQELDEHEGLDEASLREHEEVTKVKNVAFLELGEFRMETWYFTPLPKELLSERGFVEVLYVCEFSFNMFARKSELLRYQARELPKNRRHPPGNEIYRHGNLSSKFMSVSCVLDAIAPNNSMGIIKSLQCLKLMALRNESIVRISAILQNSFWITRLFTLMSTPSSSMSCAKSTIEGFTLLVTTARKSILMWATI